MNSKYILFILCFFIHFVLQAQKPSIQSENDAVSRLEESKKKLIDSKKSLWKGLKAENIGPTVQSGRVVDLDVNPENPHIFYVAYASGGLWKTENNGTSFTPLFQQEMVMTIGDFDVNWETGEIWLGSGEVNSSRSSYAGLGVFYSKDYGKTWEHKGLEDTHHIGRVIIDPLNSKTVYIAALGHLYTPNEQRGVFKSTDGGESWEKILYISENTGVVDLVMDPTNNKKLLAAAWERDRKAWNFNESGAESAIYFTDNAGEDWEIISSADSGFPAGEGTGRIGLEIVYDNDSPVIYALLDNYNRREEEKSDSEELTKEDFRNMDVNDFSKLSDESLATYLRKNGFPEKYTAEQVKKDIKTNKYKPKDLAIYIEDANRLLFDTPVKGAELYKSTDNGKSWTKTHDGYLDRVYNSYGYYFGLVESAPNNPEIVYIGGVPLLKSNDGGQTFENVNKENVHADHHTLWVNPNNHNHLINGNDGGVNISYDAGENWVKCNSPEVGQFYAVQVDYNEPYNVYGGLQDNGVWYGSHDYTKSSYWHQSGQYPYEMIMGGDGMQIQVDNRDNSTVYTGFQFGNYYRINLKTEERNYITPQHELGDRPYRWNWQSPILLSPHNQDIVYMGSNKLLRSFDQGDNFTPISPDLTNGGKKGDVAYGTITSISESPLKFGLIYTGSDDGMIYRTDNGGSAWLKLMDGLPEDYWVSRIIASSHAESVVYLALNGYRMDTFKPMIYKSDDFGENWSYIGETIPLEPVNVILEDPKHANILYVGTDNGLYISTDSGKNFQLAVDEMPKVAVHDLVIQQTFNDLIIGTHGRSIYKMDLSPLYAVNTSEDKLVVMDSYETRASERWGDKNWLRKFNEPSTELYIYSPTNQTIEIKLQTTNRKELKSENVQLLKGFNYYSFDYTIDANQEKSLRKYLELKNEIQAKENGKIYLPKGEYLITYGSDNQNNSTKLILK